MSALELLLSRKSHNKLTLPAPNNEQLEYIFKVALRAPDHALLKPWRYRVYQGQALHQLGDYFYQAAKLANPDLAVEKLEKMKTKPLRAPMVIVASVVIKEHPKVPKIEQILSGGASVQNLIMAAHFLGLGAMWRTGGMAFNPHLTQLLNFEASEILTGFIYLGTEEGEKRVPKPVDLEQHVAYFE
ncbi:nitroreductase family protein [Aliikangiella sp. IMCC44632]